MLCAHRPITRRALAAPLFAALLGACGGAAPATRPGDSAAAAAGAPLEVADGEPLGLLGFIAKDAEPRDARHWVPLAPGLGVVVPAEAPLVPGETRAVVAAPGGERASLTVGAPAPVPYGCDNSGEFPAYTLGGALPPGLAWVLPAAPPAAWTPGALPLTATTSRDEARWTAGPVTATLTRTGARTAQLSIAWADRVLQQSPVEAWSMPGADDGPIDLSFPDQPGLPNPAAAFSLSPTGPFLLVLDVSSFEGVGFDTVLVTDTAVRPVESMRLGQYYCAF
jgi:hypothetical protein